MIVLGINAYHGDSSACIVLDGKLVAAVEEERFRRVKHWAGFPADSILWCLNFAGVEPSEVDHIAVSRNPRANALRKAIFVLKRSASLPLITDRLRNAARIRRIKDIYCAAFGIDSQRLRASVHLVEHHLAHLGSTFFVSPYEDAAVASIDGFGDFVSTMVGAGRENRIKVLDRVYFPHSLGLFYLAMTQYLGFRAYGDEYKVMGLAAYGKPAYLDRMREIIRTLPSGRFELDLGYFQHHTRGASMTWDEGQPAMDVVYSRKLEKLLGPAREPDQQITPHHENVAASLQAIYEEVAFHVLNHLHRRTRCKRLCLAGGCAMNSVANGKVLERTGFEDIYIQPAAADNGTALGAAFYVWHQLLNRPRNFEMTHAYWGPGFTDRELEQAIGATGCKVRRSADQQWGTRPADGGKSRGESWHDPAGPGVVFERIDREEELLERTAGAIANGLVVGWFQGRMEWGPRALGNRSILADPAREGMRDILNLRIKFREKFRPFAPSILREATGEFFVVDHPAPFMARVYPVRPEKRSKIPAVTHVDGSGRLQTVSDSENPRYYRLIRKFQERTGIPILLNTSFNENEPICCTPQEALDCFLRTKMDVIVLGNYFGTRRPADVPVS